MLKSDVRKALDNLTAAVGQALQPQSGVSKVAGTLTSFQPSSFTHGWPDQQRFDRLSKSYDPSYAATLLQGKNCRTKSAIGWGEDLRNVFAARTGSKEYSSDGGADKYLERQGWFSVEKAANEGIKLPSGIVRKTALAEGSGVTGGYLIPPQYMAELLTIAAEDAWIEPLAKVVPMNSRTMTWPMLDITTSYGTGITPYFGGVYMAWQPEASTIGETEPQFRMSDWTAWDLVGYAVSSYQLLMDNGVGLDAVLTQLFAQATTWYKEYAFLQGKGAGSNMPLGVINAPATYLQARSGGSTNFALVDVAAMMSRLHPKSWDTAVWSMHPSVLPKLIQMTSAGAGADRLLWFEWDEATTGQKMPKVFFNGRPLYFTEKQPALGTKGDVLLVDWSYYMIGNRLDYQLDVSKDYLFRTNQLAWRFIARCDGRPWLNNTITDAAGWVSSPFVCLV